MHWYAAGPINRTMLKFIIIIIIIISVSVIIIIIIIIIIVIIIIIIIIIINIIIIITSGMPALRAGPARCVGLYHDFTVTCMQTWNIYITNTHTKKKKKKCLNYQ